MANDFRSKTRVVLTGDTIDGMASGEIWLGPVFINFISLLAEQPLELKLTKRSSEIQTDYWSFLNVITTDSLYEFASPIGWGDYEDEVATGNSDEICTLPTEQLLEALHFVMPALASDKDEFAGAKASICMNVSKLKYIITTPDGLKVNRYSEKHNSQTIKNGEYLIDQKAVKLISAFLKRTRYDEVKFLAMDSFIRISGEKEEIYLRLFDERFPATENYFKSVAVMPIVAELYAKPFVQILKRMALMVEKQPRCNLEFDGVSLKLSNDSDVNQAEENILLVTYKGEAISIVLNISHMLESLQAMNCSSLVKLRMDPTKTFVFMESDSEASKRCLLVTYK